MNISEISDKTKVELTAQGRDLRRELFNLKLTKATSQLEKPIRLRELRRDIARIETRVTQIGRKEALENLATALKGVKDFTVDGVAAALLGLAKRGSETPGQVLTAREPAQGQATVAEIPFR